MTYNLKNFKKSQISSKGRPLHNFDIFYLYFLIAISAPNNKRDVNELFIFQKILNSKQLPLKTTSFILYCVDVLSMLNHSTKTLRFLKDYNGSIQPESGQLFFLFLYTVVTNVTYYIFISS